MEKITQAQLLLSTNDLSAEISFLSTLHFQLDQIYPADDPAIATLSGHGLVIHLDKNVETTSATIHILSDHPETIADGQKEYIAPNGTIFKIKPKTYQLKRPPTQHKFEVRKLRDSDPWVIGRAGMHYRDLIPDRLGGSIIASHIRIPEGGPVPDMVHYHTIGFQLIFCYKGWVKLVYEDQGPPFILREGDCVTQPPEIRHRVLESSDHLEVIEIGVPAEHMTTIDHEMELPTPIINRDREFQGQRFCHHIAEGAHWNAWRIQGFEYRETGVNAATKNAASVHIIRHLAGESAERMSSHDADILFTFVMEGSLSLKAEGHGIQLLEKGNAFVIPPNLKHQFLNVSDDLELLEVALPGDFKMSV